MVYLALLRGLNVGAHNRIGMKDLTGVFEAIGCADVETYIQSGNVLFTAKATLVRKVPDLVQTALQEDFEVTSPVVLRDATELAAVVKGNPFLARGEDPSTLHVGFLATVPEPARVKALDPARSPPDEFQVKGRELYLRFPNGLGRSKLTNAWFDRQLATLSTVRNWNTVLELSRRADFSLALRSGEKARVRG
jgi:uncharacterized protein (DUF1697 family)